MGNILTSGPNEALIISGGCGSRQVRTIVGGWAWAWWIVTDVQRLSLNVMTLEPSCVHGQTIEGVQLDVTGVAQCKVKRTKSSNGPDEMLLRAAEQFLGREEDEIKNALLQTLEGHLRAILGTLTVEQVYKDRERFASLVHDLAESDVEDLGLTILSFTIKDIQDNVDYLRSLGKSKTAKVIRDADIGVALAERDAGIREAECEKNALDVKYITNAKVENNAREYQVKRSQFEQDVNKANAEAQLAYDLQSAKVHQNIRNEEIQIDVVERRKQIEIEEQEVIRMDQELISLVKLPAEAEAYRMQTIAQAEKFEAIAIARAESEKIRKISSAEAHAIEAVGKAEAERMRLKANVYKQYGNAAILNIVLQSLPKLAAKIVTPLAKTDKIVLIGSNNPTESKSDKFQNQSRTLSKPAMGIKGCGPSQYSCTLTSPANKSPVPTEDSRPSECRCDPSLFDSQGVPLDQAAMLAKKQKKNT
uniref:Band 7 domain-containing protein n=1 Tax=Glossina pallidipes TaxID=7398 RepID=A0A1B0A655_GLOPL